MENFSPSCALLFISWFILSWSLGRLRDSCDMGGVGGVSSYLAQSVYFSIPQDIEAFLLLGVTRIGILHHGLTHYTHWDWCLEDS